MLPDLLSNCGINTQASPLVHHLIEISSDAMYAVLNILQVALLASVVIAFANAIDLPEDDVDANILEMGPCEGYEDLPIHYSNCVLTRTNDGNLLLSGTIEIKEDVHDIEVDIDLFKCPDSNPSEETCEFQSHWGPEEGCGQLKKKEGVFYDMFKQANMENTTCPIPVDKYDIKDFLITVPHEPAKTAAMVSRYWWMRMEGTFDGKMIMCSETFGELWVS